MAGLDPSEMKGSVCERKGGRSVRETSRLAFCRLNWIEGMAQKEQCRDRIGGNGEYGCQSDPLKNNCENE